MDAPITNSTDTSPRSGAVFSASKVPEVTIFFWIIKVLCTTVGETAADYLSVDLHFGLVKTSMVTFVLLVGALAWQFAAKRYVPGRYWFAVTLVSVFGTLVTDNLTDGHKVPLTTSTMIFSALLVVVFLAWYASDRTLSIHSIRTRRREGFYWSAVLVSFALGTASGDLMAERLGFGYLATGLILAGVIAFVGALTKVRMNSILSFWVVYILTRPLGASIGDYLSQPRSVGGRGLGTTTTSYLFLGAIAAVVIYLTITKADVLTSTATESPDRAERYGLVQTIAVVAFVGVVSVVGYNARKNTLAGDTTSAAAVGATKLGDLSSFRTITTNTLDMLTAGKQKDATNRIGDLETAWDVAQARLQARDKATWTLIDGKIDVVLRRLRAAKPNVTSETAALNDLLAVLT
jgi:uncharacterized membrane-anchored protein